MLATAHTGLPILFRAGVDANGDGDTVDRINLVALHSVVCFGESLICGCEGMAFGRRPQNPTVEMYRSKRARQSTRVRSTYTRDGQFGPIHVSRDTLHIGTGQVEQVILRAAAELAIGNGLLVRRDLLLNLAFLAYPVCGAV